MLKSSQIYLLCMYCVQRTMNILFECFFTDYSKDSIAIAIYYMLLFFINISMYISIPM